VYGGFKHDVLNGVWEFLSGGDEVVVLADLILPVEYEGVSTTLPFSIS
jgi:hypothetical protein